MTTPLHSLRLLGLAAPLMVACGDDGTTDDAADPTTTTTASAETTGPGSTGATEDGETTTSMDSTSDGSTGMTSGSTGTDPSESTGEAGLEIAGDWFEEFAPGEGIDHVITEARWDQLAAFGDAIFHVDSYDNATRWVVAQGDPDNMFSPNLYSKFNWTWDGDVLYYCTATFDEPTAQDAQDAPDGDPGDLLGGCAGFPWSLLMPAR